MDAYLRCKAIERKGAEDDKTQCWKPGSAVARLGGYWSDCLGCYRCDRRMGLHRARAAVDRHLGVLPALLHVGYQLMFALGRAQRCSPILSPRMPICSEAVAMLRVVHECG